MLYCNNCNRIFDESEACRRRSVREDGVPSWWGLAVCPVCRSDDIEEASVCERCGSPIPPEEMLCDVCEGDLWGITDRAVKTVGGDYFKAKELFFDYLERRWF